ncbi:MAG: AAA family ATPase [Magnetococcales bacterium]|nr:AAA family ATPase [Magnetococcales bacterium]
MKYCTRCAMPLGQLCTHCHTPFQTGDLFCGACGRRLLFSETTLPVLPAVSPVAHHIPAVESKSNGQPPASERKNVTVLFADISGFTSMSEKLDPEVVTDVMNGCLKMLADIVVRYEGYVDKFIGDCIMAIFGAPITHENDPELAIRAAMDMKREMAEYNKNLPFKLEKPLTLHIGINSGPVIAGGVGSDRKMEYTVMGDTVNLASRLESLATSGQIFVSVYTYNQTRHLFEFQTHDPIQVKGKKEPVAVFEVVKQKGLKSQERRGGVTVPLVGRAQEISTLDHFADELRRGEGRTVFLISEPGIGKSRIQLEVKSRLKDGEILTLEGICRSFGRNTSFYVYLDIFRHLCNIDSEDMEEAIAEKVENTIPLLLSLDPQVLSEEARESIFFIGMMLGVRMPSFLPYRIENLEAQEIKMATFRAVAWFFRTLSTARPLLLILEDLHNADAPSIELTAYLFESLVEQPVLLLMLMRPTQDHPSAKLPLIAKKYSPHRTAQLHFDRLSPTECDQMVQNLLRSEVVPETILTLVRSRADGNPMYIEEIVHNLLDEGIIQLDHQGIIQVLRDPESTTLPSSIQGLIIARIDRLQSDMKDILHAAAVIGPVFRLALLQRLFAERNLDERLQRLVDMGLIFESRTFPEVEYSFRNILTQEAVYSTLLHKRARELHEEVAREIEALFANRLEEHYEVLAHHCLKAGQEPRAVHYLILGGQRAQEAQAPQEAAILFERALQLAKELPEASVNLDAIHEGLAESQERSGALQGAIQARQFLLSRLEDPLARGTQERRIGKMQEKLGDMGLAMACFDRAEKHLVGHAEAVETGLLYLNQSWILNRLGRRPEAIAKAEAALSIFERKHAAEEIALACNNLGVFHEHAGNLEKAESYNLKSLRLFSQQGNRHQTANLYLSLGFLHDKMGQPAAALDYFSRSHEIMTRIGNRFGMATALMCRGRCLVAGDRLEEGEKALLDALEMHRHLEATRKIAANEWELASLYMRTNNLKAAREHLEGARHAAQRQNDPADIARTTAMEAQLLLLEGRRPETKLKEAIALYRKLANDREVNRLTALLEEWEKRSL